MVVNKVVVVSQAPVMSKTVEESQALNQSREQMGTTLGAALHLSSQGLKPRRSRVQKP